MTQWIRASILFFSMLFASLSFADYSVSYLYGGFRSEHPRGLSAYQFGFQDYWNVRWFQTPYSYLSGFWDFSVGHLTAFKDPRNENVGQSSFTSFVPMFRFQLTPGTYFFAPYVQGGIGPALISDTRLGNGRYSTAYQFDDRLDVGLLMGAAKKFDISFGFHHMSNGHIKTPNNGINIYPAITGRYRFG